MDPKVELIPVRDAEMDDFKRRMQIAFTLAAQAAFPDFGETIPPARDIDESLGAPGAEALQVVHDGRNVGGAITAGTDGTKLLDFIFIDPEYQNLHLGHAAWCAIEARYPDARIWELVTPYHEKRNIHFYVNRCGFHIVEYFNKYHEDPEFSTEDAGDYPGSDEGLFRFVKVMS